MKIESGVVLESESGVLMIIDQEPMNQSNEEDNIAETCVVYVRRLDGVHCILVWMQLTIHGTTIVWVIGVLEY